VESVENPLSIWNAISTAFHMRLFYVNAQQKSAAFRAFFSASRL